MTALAAERERMIAAHLGRRGITDPRVLDAFRAIPREEFLPPELAEFAYDDTPLPIAEGQTISQPYIVALTVQALQLTGGERVLEVGTGSGYAAAILGQIAGSVFTIERFGSLAQTAAARLRRLGCVRVEVKQGDGSLGWAEHAPYDAIAVAAGGPLAPPALLAQLKVGGRLVMPIGPEGGQELMRITRDGEGAFRSERLGAVRFVPLIGVQGFPGTRGSPSQLVREVAERIDDLASAPLDAIVDRVGDARVVLIGEATHGTSEFYRMRARLTQALVQRRGFQFVAIEGDWPDAARVNDYVHGDARRSGHDFVPFERFPTWMWRNDETRAFVEWLRAFNAERPDRKVGFHGLDLYSLFTSIAAVLHYLDGIDPAAAAVARQRYGALTPWQQDPAAYGRAVLTGRYKSSEAEAVEMLRDLLKARLAYVARDGDRFFDATQNARLVADAEGYYRALYYGSVRSWNLRDTHMFDTLQSLFGYYGPRARGVVWEHNSHVGDARATEMGLRGEHNVGQLCRGTYGDQAYLIGQGTHDGTVIAASDWDGPAQRMTVRPSIPGSYEQIFHDAHLPAFALHLRAPERAAVRDELMNPRLERAIGVIYRPDTERGSHYFEAALPAQFDEYFWFDRTQALSPIAARPGRPTPGGELPETWPFGQ